MSSLFDWQNSSSWIHSDDYVGSFSLTKFVLMNSWRRLSCGYSSDKIRSHKFMATIMSRLFQWQNSFSWIHGDDYVGSFSLTICVLIISWRRLCRVFSSDKIRPHKFMAMIMSGFFHWQNSSSLIHGDDYVESFDWQNSSSLIHGDDYVESFRLTKFFLMNS